MPLGAALLRWSPHFYQPEYCEGEVGASPGSFLAIGTGPPQPCLDSLVRKSLGRVDVRLPEGELAAPFASGQLSLVCFDGLQATS